MSTLNLDDYPGLTPQLRKALQEVLKLPVEEQERIGQWLLGELRTDEDETDPSDDRGKGNNN